MALTCLGQGTGTIRYEVWEGIGGTVITDLTGNAAYPDNPSWDDELTLFETPTNRADNFGGRVYGWLTPDTTGDYTFWIATDDAGELWLSTTDSAVDAQLIALEDSWAGSRAWSNDSSQSAPISLVAGQAYYIEALYKEGGGGDNLAVGWAMSSDINDVQVIDGAYLTPAPRNPNVLKARIVAPANGAIEVGVDAILEWTAGPTATSHVVYLSTDEIIDEADMLVETTDTNAVPALEPGATYYWRVDEVDADGINEGYLWSFTVISDQAHYPHPADGDLWRLGLDTEMSWTAGVGGMVHHVYFSTDKALVDARDMSVATMYWPTATFDPGELTLGATYYWAVDEFGPAGTFMSPTWSFKVFSFDPVAITDASLVLRYTFDEIQGGLINDLSGHENFGTVVGDLQIVTMGGDNAMAFAGTADSPQYVDAGLDSSLTTTGNVTIATWVKMNEGNDGAYMGIGGKLKTNGYQGFALVRHSSNVFRLWADNGAGEIAGFDATSDATYTDTEWHYLVGVVDANISTLYVDDVKQAKQGEGVALMDSGEYAFVGKQYSAPDVHRYWNGLIDDFRIYNKALTDLEIHRLYDPTIEDPNLLIHYDFEGGDGTMAVDQSGHGNDGLFMGTPELVKGRFGTAVSIVLEDVDYIETAAPLNITSNTVSVAGWVMHDETPAAWSGILTTRGDGGNFGLQQNGMETGAAELRYMWGPDLYWSFSSGLKVPNGEWYFAALAISPDRAMFYLNGIGVDQTATNVAPHDPVTFDGLIRVGRDHQDSRIMTSLIDEVRFFDRTITGEDVQRLMMELPSPVAHWTFDDGAGAVALDSSGNGNDGVLIGDPQWVPGKIGGALELDGDGDFVDCGDSPVFDIPVDITVATWVNIAQFDKNWQAIITKGDSSWRLHRSSSSSNIAWGTTGVEPLDLTSVTAIDDAEWHHLAGVYDGAQKLLYIDGLLDVSADATGNISSNAYNVNIGENGEPMGRYLTGLVDDVRIYNVALSAAQIGEIIQGEAAKKPLIVWVSFHGADDAPSSGAADAGFTEAADKGYTDLLTANGYDVVRYVTTKTPDVEFLNTADLVMISRSVDSGNYSTTGASLWNSVTAPMIITGGYPLRNSRMGYTLGGTMVDTVGDITLTVNDASHPIFAGIDLVDGVTVNPFAGVVSYDDGTLCYGVSVNTNEVNAEGTVLATVATASDPTAGGMVIGEWQAGAALTHDGGDGTDILAGHRLVFLTGSRENGKSSQTAGLYDLYEDGATMLLNAVEYMLQ